MRLVAEQLELPAEELEVRLYKLLVYENGGFFLPHRDSEKLDRMLASMIVVLPNRFEGGSRVISFVRESPDAFSLDECQVPRLKSLIPWSRTQFGLVHSQMVSCLAAACQKLESETALQPAPPANWGRPADVPCRCQY